MTETNVEMPVKKNYVDSYSGNNVLEYLTRNFGKMVPITHVIDQATLYVK